MSSFVVGVDGGTTKTIALVADDEGHILGASRGGNSNWTGPDVEAPMRVVAETVREALRQAGLSGDDIAMGAFIQGKDIALKRSGQGLDPSDFEAVAGKRARVLIKKDEPITKEKIEE